MKPVVLIELNEVPNQVLDAYARQSPFMAQWLSDSDRYTTVAADRIQLDPWIAWPSFHRGVNDETHGILHLGQDSATAEQYSPVWSLLQQQGLNVGVYGSLFSSAEADLSSYSFFVPDVFSPHNRVKPYYLRDFQDFNLRMTRASGRNADDGVAAGGSKAIAGLALSRRIRATTLSRVARQLAIERVNRKRLSRRRNMQTELHADIFNTLLNDHHPHFSTFYTNNVAAAMHRFWSASLREHSINTGHLEDEWLDDYSDEIFAALCSVERLLRQLQTGHGSNAIIVLASAIGQEEIPAENHRNFLTITTPELFIHQVMGAPHGTAELIPTMVPDFTIRFPDSDAARLACTRIEHFSINGHKIVQTPGRMHSKELVAADSRLAYIRHEYASEDFKHPLTYCRSDDRTVHISLQIDDFDGPPEAYLGDQRVGFSDIGVGLVQHDEGVNCTAQHCAEGSLIVHRSGIKRGSGEKARRISSLDFTPSVLKHFGAPLPDYLQGEPIISLQ